AAVELLEQGSNRPPLTKDGEVRQEISAILGLTVDQFRKIVMIPQGDFKEFLVAGTKDKEELLRKIFGTFIYKDIQEKLQENASMLKSEVSIYQQEIQSALTALPDSLQESNGEGNAIEILQEEAKKVLGQKEAVQLKLAEHKKQSESVRLKWEEARSANQLLEEKGRVEQELTSLKGQSEAMENTKNEIVKIREAEKLEVQEKAKNRLKASYEELCQSEAAQKQQLELLAVRLHDAKTRHDGLPREEEKAKQLMVEESQLKGWGAELRQLIPFQEKLAVEIQEARKLKLRLEQVEKGMAESRDFLKGAEKVQDGLLALEKEISQMNLKLQQISVQIKEKKEALLQFERWQGACQSLEALKANYIKRQNDCSGRKSAYETKATAYLHAAAARLAEELEIGQGCPVCGSLEHPSPAIFTQGSISKEELDQSKAAYDNAQLAENQALADYTRAQAEEKNLRGDFQQEDKEELLATLSKLEASKQAMGNGLNESQRKKIDQEAILGKVGRERGRFKQGEEEQNSIKTALEKLQVSIQSTQKAQEAAKNRIPALYRDLPILELEISRVARSRQEIESKIEKTRQEFSKVSTSYQGTEGAIHALGQRKTIALGEINRAESEFSKAYAKHFPSLESYHEALQKKSGVSQLEAVLQQFGGRLQAAKQRLVELAPRITGTKFQDLNPLMEKLQLLDVEKEQLSTELLGLGHQGTLIANVLTQVSRRYGKIKDKEEEYKVVGELAELANGRTAGKMTFETFVLSGYFDRVLDSANGRLDKMTSGRYYLLRQEVAKGGGRKGLELDVYDSHTCKKRSISTLSGGESFKASLALALGLSDTVQQNAGGIILNTMFIDEGFGTLDPNSLEQAVDILMDLQDHGRLIGVISHVAELKDRIPAKLLVTSGLSGSTAKFQL
ncbi:MAG: SMC family ATPase, partial [Turicibacter sp.]|nr:SMC family ATPase [Turicibacter sp.]